MNVGLTRRRDASPDRDSRAPSSSSSSSDTETDTDSSNYKVYRRYVMPACYKLNLAPGKSFNTPYFYSPKRPWFQFCMRVFPRGEGTSHPDRVSVYIELRSPTMLGQFANIRANVSLSLIGQSQDRKAINYGVVGTKTGTISRTQGRFGWDCIMTREELFDRYRDVLKRGRFQFVIDMDYTIEGVEYALFNTAPDCYIAVGSVRFPVHWDLLQVQAPNIGRYVTNLYNNMPEINLPDANPVAVHVALMYIYYDEVPQITNIISVMNFASTYGFDDLHKLAKILLDC
uniref:MATH domain-containing protein n=1 Tax=Panagrellus redivivus TaxID=6233 RepID=A0A7E4USK4_PANRE